MPKRSPRAELRQECCRDVLYRLADRLSRRFCGLPWAALPCQLRAARMHARSKRGKWRRPRCGALLWPWPQVRGIGLAQKAWAQGSCAGSVHAHRSCRRRARRIAGGRNRYELWPPLWSPVQGAELSCRRRGGADLRRWAVARLHASRARRPCRPLRQGDVLPRRAHGRRRSGDGEGVRAPRAHGRHSHLVARQPAGADPRSRRAPRSSWASRRCSRPWASRWRPSSGSPSCAIQNP